MYELICVGVFLAAYLVNTTMISVFYHRGLAHGAVALRPWATRLAANAGIWLTGLDPKAWVCMHRRHHVYSDTPRDPHSPVRFGLFGVLVGQLRSYERTLVGLARNEADYADLVADLDFDISRLNRRRVWFLPYVAHLAIALVVALPTGMWALAACYWLGMMSHPIEGWIVNSFGHAIGGRNFETPDNSRNNHVAAWLIVGEGYQNNHHRYPASARFSYRWWEVDLGYGICMLLERLGVLEIERATLIPSYSRRAAALTATLPS
jgi:fatty-acid desaturase